MHLTNYMTRPKTSFVKTQGRSTSFTTSEAKRNFLLNVYSLFSLEVRIVLSELDFSSLWLNLKLMKLDLFIVDFSSLRCWTAHWKLRRDSILSSREIFVQLDHRLNRSSFSTYHCMSSIHSDVCAYGYAIISNDCLYHTIDRTWFYVEVKTSNNRVGLFSSITREYSWPDTLLSRGNAQASLRRLC